VNNCNEDLRRTDKSDYNRIADSYDWSVCEVKIVKFSSCYWHGNADGSCVWLIGISLLVGTRLGYDYNVQYIRKYVSCVIHAFQKEMDVGVIRWWTQLTCSNYECDEWFWLGIHTRLLTMTNNASCSLCVTRVKYDPQTLSRVNYTVRNLLKHRPLHAEI
jgi:hypothetical protein